MERDWVPLWLDVLSSYICWVQHSIFINKVSFSWASTRSLVYVFRFFIKSSFCINVMPTWRMLANTLSCVVIRHGQLPFLAAFYIDPWHWAFSTLSAAGDKAESGGWYTWCKIAPLQLPKKFRILVKFLSFRIHWLSNQVAIAEVICMTLFPFSQAKLPSCSRQKLIKQHWRKYDFFFTLHKAVKKLKFASFAFNVQNLSHGSRHNPDFGAQPVEFPSKGNRKSIVGEEDGIDFSCCWQGCSHSKEQQLFLLHRQSLFQRWV